MEPVFQILLIGEAGFLLLETVMFWKSQTEELG
jgi:hypothetical protein